MTVLLGAEQRASKEPAGVWNDGGMSERGRGPPMYSAVHFPLQTSCLKTLSSWRLQLLPTSPGQAPAAQRPSAEGQPWRARAACLTPSPQRVHHANVPPRTNTSAASGFGGNKEPQSQPNLHAPTFTHVENKKTRTGK